MTNVQYLHGALSMNTVGFTCVVHTICWFTTSQYRIILMLIIRPLWYITCYNSGDWWWHLQRMNDKVIDYSCVMKLSTPTAQHVPSSHLIERKHTGLQLFRSLLRFGSINSPSRSASDVRSAQPSNIFYNIFVSKIGAWREFGGESS